MPHSQTFIAVVLLAGIFSGLLSPAVLLAETKTGIPTAGGLPILEVPDTLEGVKEGTEKVGKEVAKVLPNIIQTIWQNEILPVWQNMLNWTNEILWQKYALPIIQQIGDRAKTMLGQEVEKRKPIIEQELEQEKEELKKELKIQSARAGQSLWERFKALLR